MRSSLNGSRCKIERTPHLVPKLALLLRMQQPSYPMHQMARKYPLPSRCVNFRHFNLPHRRIRKTLTNKLPASLSLIINVCSSSRPPPLSDCSRRSLTIITSDPSLWYLLYRYYYYQCRITETLTPPSSCTVILRLEMPIQHPGISTLHRTSNQPHARFQPFSIQDRHTKRSM